MTSDQVKTLVADNKRDFFDSISKRKATLCAYDFDDGCTGYAQIWDKDGEDYEYIDSVDLSCLESIKNSNGDNGHTDADDSDIASTESEVEVETPQESEPSNGGTSSEEDND